MTLRIINIAPLFAGHQAEITADLLRLHRDCGVTDVAFMLPLSPEERNPTMAKAEYLRDLFVEARERLRGSGLNVGILLQSLIGHGVPTEARFQRSVNSNGVTTSSMCPMDPDFQDYVRDAVATAARTRPDFLLVDDDFRLANNGGTGCFCNRHLAAFNRASGGTYDQASLVAALREERTASGHDLQRSWDEWRGESLRHLARIIRGAIDAADPDLPCGLCMCHALGSELQFSAAIAHILAGKKPPLVRIGNSFYWDNNPAGLLNRVYWTAIQMEAMKGIPEILAESDTFPHNRYATPAKAINGQIIFSLLNGTTGSKLWLTRMSEYEPESGLAYREMMKDNLAAYRQLRELYPAIRWDEPVTPLPRSGVPPLETGIWENNWACRICGHMGIPSRVGNGETAAIMMLAGPEVDYFSDQELRAFLSRGVLLDGLAAEKMCQRGFAGLLGVEVESPPGWKVSLERLNDAAINGRGAGRQIALSSFVDVTIKKITVKEKGVQVLSDICHSPWYACKDETRIGAGVTLFENPLGGRAAVFAATLGYLEYLNEVRRTQLINVLDWLNRAPLPVVVVSDLDLYARHGVMAPEQGGGELLAVFNLNMDTVSELRLRTGGRPLKTISRLTGAGGWEEQAWQAISATESLVPIPVETMKPLILRLWRN